MPKMSMKGVPKIKEFYSAHKSEILLGIIIFLVSLLSFNLGALSSRQDKTPIIIEKCGDIGVDL